jgi:hypothetical protein
MWEFRKRFCQGLKQTLQEEVLTLPEGTTTRQWRNRLNKANRRKWEVFLAKPPEDGGPTTEEILRYQAEDVAGGPVSGDRLISGPEVSATQLAYLKSAPLHADRLEDAPEGHVSFRWGAYDPATGRRERTQIETVSGQEFLRRYLQHVPPPGYQTVRHYGLYAGGKKAAYDQCGNLLHDHQPPAVAEVADGEQRVDTDAWLQTHTCPVCGQSLIVTAHLRSSLTGRLVPRVPLGYVFARPPTPGEAHAS